MRAAIACACLALLAAPAAARPRPDLGEAQAEIVSQTNAFRRIHGLEALSPDARLQAAAQAFAAYLAGSGRFSHTADGREPWDRAQAAGYDYCEVAENIAYAQDSRGFHTDQLADQFVKGWEGSAGHRENMLRPSVVDTAVAIARSPRGGEAYLAVQMFGRPSSERFSFSVQNGSDQAAAYRFEGQRYALAPGETIRHTTCAPSDLAFEGQARPYAAQPGALYVLRATAAGTRIEVDHPGGAQ